MIPFLREITDSSLSKETLAIVLEDVLQQLLEES